MAPVAISPVHLARASAHSDAAAAPPPPFGATSAKLKQVSLPAPTRLPVTVSLEERRARNEAKLRAVQRDFRTDTITVPNELLRDALANASMGDSIYREDDDTNALEAWMAELTGMEAAMFCVSGTMVRFSCLRHRLPRLPRVRIGLLTSPLLRRRTNSESGRTCGNLLTAS